MSALRRRSVFIVIAVVVAGLLAAGRLGRRPRAASTRAAPVAAAAPAARDKPVAVRALDGTPSNEPAVAADPAGSAPSTPVTPVTPITPAAPSAATNVVAQQMRVTDRSDRALLAEFERAGAKWPASVAGELIALQKRGATRSSLEAFIAQRLPDNVPARLAATRWLRAKFPAGSAAAAAGGAAPKPLGNGGGERRVSPLPHATSTKTGMDQQEGGKTGSPN